MTDKLRSLVPITLAGTAVAVLGFLLLSPSKVPVQAADAPPPVTEPLKKITKTESEWKALLTKEQFRIVRKKGTERAFTGTYWNNKEKGVYHCVACDLPLFDSKTKYKSGTGWPSYWKPVNETYVGKKVDRSFFTTRTEVVCNRCDGHLGHVFDDGPQPTGLRYCINSASLKFRTTNETDETKQSDKEKKE